jgi:hypothetical protein
MSDTIERLVGLAKKALAARDTLNDLRVKIEEEEDGPLGSPQRSLWLLIHGGVNDAIDAFSAHDVRAINYHLEKLKETRE